MGKIILEDHRAEESRLSPPGVRIQMVANCFHTVLLILDGLDGGNGIEFHLIFLYLTNFHLFALNVNKWIPSGFLFF